MAFLVYYVQESFFSLRSQIFCISAVSGICSLKETVTKSGRWDALLASRISQLSRLLNSYSSWERAPIRDFICGHIPVLSFGCHFGLDVHQFRPYSLRRGGATHIFQCSGSMGLAMLKGRWQSSQVARIYISNWLSYLPNSKMSPDTDKLLRQYHFFSYHQGWQWRSGGLRLESWNGMSWRRWKLFRAARWPVSTMRQDFKSPYHERGWINVSAFNQEGINQFQVSPKCWKRQGLKIKVYVPATWDKELLIEHKPSSFL